MRIVIGLLITAVALAIAGRRVFWLFRLIRSGQPQPDRFQDKVVRAETQVTEVFGQRKLLKWTVPGIAHFFTFWGFLVLGLTIVEAYAALFKQDWAGFGQESWLGAVEDFFAAAVLLGIVTFAIIRLRQDPHRIERRSRFYGSHTRAAWGVLGMIFLVVATLVVYRGAQIRTGDFPYTKPTVKASFFSYGVSQALSGFSRSTNHAIETTFILLQLAVVLAFLVLVVYSKHLHIFVAPLNVMFSRRPNALGPLLPMTSGGKPINFEDPGEDDKFGVGVIEDFSWKRMLDMATCTECGRCQSQCPAWNTGKPLSPKLLITELRDHLFAKAPYLLGKELPSTDGHAPLEAQKAAEGTGHVPAMPANERPLVGPTSEGGVIDPDVLWSCTTCGACVEQCPVDIEHIDHIVDMRRYQVLIESAFPSEAGVMLRNIENNGNPWGVSPRTRTEWTEGLPFEVRILAEGEPIPDDVEYLFWVGCAGAIEDRSKKVTRSFAELLHTAGVNFAVLGTGETCTGDPARRLGAEHVFFMQAQQNIEVLNAAGADKKKIVATCPHCFNTLNREYPQFGGNYEVVHHTQLLGQLVAEGRLVPVTPIDEKITYHDPCYLGRHNKVYTPPREVLGAITGLRNEEMHRCKDRGFCCGAGGARMWMEEHIGKRVNVERVDEALALDPDAVVTSCPFCMVMLSDAVTSKQQDGTAREGVVVYDVTQMLARSLVPSAAREPAAVGAVSTAAAAAAPSPAPSTSAAPAAEGTPSATSEALAADATEISAAEATTAVAPLENTDSRPAADGQVAPGDGTPPAGA